MLGRWGQRTRGEPPSANGASSFHLWWQLDTTEPLVTVAATLEVIEPPTVPRLYFWTLQAGFYDGRRDLGAGHAGLQWVPDPAGRPQPAVNWGGYRDPSDGGGELDGSTSPLPGVAGNPNTRHYQWQPGRPYRLTIGPTQGGWRATVTDEGTDETTTVRDLWAPSGYLTQPVVWSEAFARCDDPTVLVRWSRMRARTARGDEVSPSRVSVTYQAHAEGGCDNTTVAVDEVGVCQATSSDRRVSHGAVLAVPPS